MLIAQWWRKIGRSCQNVGSMNFAMIGFLCTCNYHYQLADKYFICALKFAANKC